MDIKEIALKVADSLRNKVDGVSHMQSNQGLVRFAEALVAELAKQNEPVLYAEFAEDGGWLGVASEYQDYLEEPHELYTSNQVAAAILKATKPLEERLSWLDYTEKMNKALVVEIEELHAQLAAAQEEGATVTSERDNLWFKLETAKAELADLRDQLAKTEQRVAELIGELEHTREQKNLLWFEFSIATQKLAASQEEIDRLEKIVLSAQDAAIENGAALKSTQDQLATAEQRVAEAFIEYMVDLKQQDFAFTGSTVIGIEKCETAIRSGEWRKFVKEV